MMNLQRETERHPGHDHQPINAIECVKTLFTNRRMTRRAWRGSRYLVLVRPNWYLGPLSFPHAWIALVKHADSPTVGQWIPTPDDLLADDYEEYEH